MTLPERFARLRVLLACALLAACGGGVGTGGTGDSVVGAFGPITSFGSIVVAGTVFDDTNAVVVGDDGRPLARDGRELRLGMTVEVEATGDLAARRVTVVAGVAGPVQAVDAAARHLTVLGQRVRVDGATVFDASLGGGLAGLRAGDRIVAYTLPDPLRNEQRATRIERADDATVLRVRGVVSALDAATRRFRIGSIVFDYAGASGVPQRLANGDVVRLRVAAPAAGSPLVVLAFDHGGGARAPGREIELDGMVTAYTSVGDFSVDGVHVDARAARIEPASMTLAAGQRVEVRGRMDGDVLVAERVKIDPRADLEQRVYKLDGRVESVDAAARSFVLRKTTVDHTNARFDGGSAADLAPGVPVRVEGRLAGGGTRLEATRVEFR